MLLEYIRKNKLLFVFGLVILIQMIICIGLLILEDKAYFVFESIKSDASIKDSIKDIEWSFTNYVWKSGDVMSTYGNISRLQGYQDNAFGNLVTSLFTGNKPNTSTATTSGTNYSTLVNNFSQFNLLIQSSTALVCLLGISMVFNTYVFFVLLWDYLITAEIFNFQRLAMVIFFHLTGFFVSYMLERMLFKKEKERKWLWLYNLDYIKKIRSLKYLKGSFNVLNDANNTILETKNLCFSCSPGKKWFRRVKDNFILKDINLKIKKGSFNVIIGPNGSGKTTLIKSLINLNEGTYGEILWNGQEISSINRTEFARQVSYIPQFLNLQNSIPILDFLEFSRYPYKKLANNSPQIDEKAVIQAIKKNDCEKLKDRMVDELSGGQKQKIMLTSVLVQESEVIILDEPTSFLDLKNQHQFLETLKDFQKKGKTIIMILHDLHQSINYADNLIILKEGTIHASGHPRDVITSELLKNIFRIKCDILKTGNGIQINNIHAI